MNDMPAVHRPLLLTLIAVALSTTGSSAAGLSADEHASHHPQANAAAPMAGDVMPGSTAIDGASSTAMPGAGTSAAAPMSPADPGGAQGATGMNDGPGAMGMGGVSGAMGMMDPSAQVGRMDEMMAKMGAPKPRDLYPTLMTMGFDTEADLQQALEIARRRAHEGEMLMEQARASLELARAGSDPRATIDATERLQQATRRYRSGIAAEHALLQRRPPADVAMTWFRKEMNLLPPAGEAPLLLGMSTFHTGVMVILILFAGFSAWMYGYRMRRAAALMTALVEGKPIGDPEAFDGVLAHPRDAPGAQNPTTPISRRETWVGDLRVIGIFDETPGVKTFRMAMPDESPLPFAYEPGQFATLTLDVEGGKPVKRSYTIASSPTQRDAIELTIKREDQGVGSRHLHDTVEVGSKLRVSAPQGRFFFNGTQSEKVVLMAGGVGITPMMSALRYLTDHCWPGEIHLLYVARTPADIIFAEEIARRVQRHPNAHPYITVTRPEGTDWDGPTGRLDARALAAAVVGIEKGYRVHICGPQAMMDAARAALEELGVAAADVKTEAFGPPASPAADAPKAPRPATGTTHKVRFGRSSVDAVQGADQVLLDVADTVGVEIDRSCLAGTCGACIVRLTAGEVTMAVDDALEADERENGWILACQARAVSDLEVDA